MWIIFKYFNICFIIRMVQILRPSVMTHSVVYLFLLLWTQSWYSGNVWVKDPILMFSLLNQNPFIFCQGHLLSSAWKVSSYLKYNYKVNYLQIIYRNLWTVLSLVCKSYFCITTFCVLDLTLHVRHNENPMSYAWLFANIIKTNEYVQLIPNSATHFCKYYI